MPTASASTLRYVLHARLDTGHRGTEMNQKQLLVYKDRRTRKEKKPQVWSHVRKSPTLLENEQSRHQEEMSWTTGKALDITPKGSDFPTGQPVASL